MLGIVSDIHSNWAALEAVLNQCRSLGVQRLVCLGDCIGYGPDPVEVSRVASQQFAVSLLGNHEEALVTGRHHFNPYAAAAIDWTRDLLRREAPDLLTWYAGRVNHSLWHDDAGRARLLLVHGSIYDPVHDYVDEPDNPVAAEDMITTLEQDFSGFDLCFAGHNHTPFVATGLGTLFPHDGHRSFRLPAGHRAYVCVGSVGQPRDRDPRASFATLSGEELTFHRVPYDIQRTQARIRAAGLHPFLADRLAMGE